MFDFMKLYELSPFAKLLIVLGVIGVIAGAYILLTGFIPLVPKRYRKNVKDFKETGISKTHASGNVEASLQRFSKQLATHIHMSAIERAEMQKALRLSDMTETPEEYKAYMYIATGVFLLLAFVVFMFGIILPLNDFYKTGTKVIAVAVSAAGLAMYFINKRKINARKRDAIIEIERELPRFVSYLNNALQTEQSSVLAILERYIANEDRFQAELKMTIVDAKSANFNKAMAAWDARCNSDQLKMVTHGLISANDGNDVRYYFAMLERDFSAFEVAALRKSVKSIPQQMRLPKMLLMISVFAALFYPILYTVLKSVALFFQ